MYQDNTGLYIERDKFIPIQEYYEYPNQKKEQIKRMMMYWAYTMQVIKKMPDIIKHWKDVSTKDNELIKIPLWLIWGKWADRIEDRTNYTKVEHPKFLWELYPVQLEKVNELLQNRIWLMNASTWVGKAHQISYIAQKLWYKTLIIVPWIQLLNEMVERIELLLWVTSRTYWWKKQSKKTQIYENIIVSTLDSMINIEETNIWCILIDECDKSLTTEGRLEFIEKLSPKYFYWFTWTMKINNVHDKIFNIFFWQTTKFIQKNFIPDVFRIRTEFEYSWWYNIDYDLVDNEKEKKNFLEFSSINNEIALDEERNNSIVEIISKYLPKTEMKKGLVLSNRVEHCRILSDKLEKLWICTRIIVWEIKKEEREQIKIDVASSKVPIVLLWSASILWRWFDLKELQSIFIVYPTRFNSSVIQACGRVQRVAPNKTYSQIFDFIDVKCWVLNNQANQRLRTMKREYWPIKITNIY